MFLAIPSSRGAVGGGFVSNTFKSAALDLNFASTKSLVDAKTGQNLVTFTRASSGSYVGSDGLIKTATTNEARFDHNPTTGESLGLLVEEQRTNLLLRSEEFDNASWAKTASSTTPDNTVAPNGANAADKLIDTAVNTQHVVQQIITPIASTAYTYSCYLKAGERTQGAVGLTGAGNSDSIVIFNLSTGTYISTAGVAPTAYSITPAGSGWYRCSITWTATTTAAMGVRLYTANSNTITYTGDGASGIYIWGAQLEAGTFPTSYISTTTATVTRSADVASITGTNFSSWYNSTGGTFYGESDRATGISSTSTLCSVNDNTLNNRYLNIRHDSSSLATSLSITAGVTDGSAQATLNSGNPRNRIATAQVINDLAIAANGSLGPIDTSVAIPTVTQLQIGSVTAASYYNGTIRRLTYWPQRLSNSTLQTLTQ